LLRHITKMRSHLSGEKEKSRDANLGSVVTRFYTIEQYSELVLLPKKKILVSRIVLL